MTIVNFNCHFQSDELASIDLPIEIRRSNYSLVARTVKSGSIKLEPGDYHVSTRLPGGQDIHTPVQIVAGMARHTVQLRPENESLSPEDALEASLLLLGRTRAVFAPKSDERWNESVGATSPEGDPSAAGLPRVQSLGRKTFELRDIRGNPAIPSRPDSQHAPALPAIVRLPNGTSELAKFVVPAGDQRSLLLLQPSMPSRVIVLPVSVRKGCELIVTDRAEEGVSIDVRLMHAGADALMRYMAHGQFDNASIASQSVEAEDLLQAKKDDPIAASVGAYALLRLGELDRLHDWTQNLSDWFAEIPDGAAIRGEQLARRGQHQQALVEFLKLRQRGVPIFADGLSYAVNRLRQHLSRTKKLSSADDSAMITLSMLEPFAEAADYGRILTTYLDEDINSRPLEIDVAPKTETPLVTFTFAKPGADLTQLERGLTA